jgi:hypothetical protein
MCKSIGSFCYWSKREILILLCCVDAILNLPHENKIALLPFSAYCQEEKPMVDIVFCLDLSGTTNGLLESVKENVWQMIVDLDRFEPRPNVRIGLVVHGRPSFGKENDYAKILINLTQDLDFLGTQLFSRSFFLEKGNPNPKKALDLALNQINWSDDDRAVKLLYVIGNRELNLDASEIVSIAKEKKINVSTIYYKKYSKAKELQEWLQFADVAGGELIMSDGAFRKPGNYPEFKSKEMDGLNKKLNATYIYYAPGSEERMKMQLDLDDDAAHWGQNLFQSRVIAKSTKLYQGKNYFWDLVDLTYANDLDFKKIVSENLPEQYKSLNPEQLKEAVMKKRSEREAIISEISLISSKREQYIADKKKELSIKEDGNVGVVIINALKKAMSSNGFHEAMPVK